MYIKDGGEVVWRLGGQLLYIYPEFERRQEGGRRENKNEWYSWGVKNINCFVGSEDEGIEVDISSLADW